MPKRVATTPTDQPKGNQAKPLTGRPVAVGPPTTPPQMSDLDRDKLERYRYGGTSIHGEGIG